MKVLPTRLPGPLLVAPTVFGDSRGFFVETFRASTIGEFVGAKPAFVQDNHSRSARGVIRGMHFQLDPPAAKLVRCARGAIVDVVVDVRGDSEAFGQWEAYELDDSQLRTLFVPAGFAHGFCVLSEVADVVYRQTAYWHPGADRGFSPLDPDVGIEWPVPPEARILSERDRTAPRLRDIADALAT